MKKDLKKKNTRTSFDKLFDTSPAGSFKGWKLTKWFVKNKDSLKMLLMGVSALTTYFATAANPAWLQILLTLIVPALIKLGVDSLDYVSSEQISLK